MTKSCVVFAIGINTPEKLPVLQEYITMLKEHFSDCDIYAGINYGAHANIEHMLHSSGLNIKVDRLTDEKLHVDSDASSYQLALKNVVNSKIKYDVIWFVHTKGGHNSRDHIRSLYIDHFYPHRKFIESKFSELEHLGVFGYRSGHYNFNNEISDKCLGVNEKLIRDIWDGPTKFMPNSFCKYIVIETMFAMNANIIYKFIEEYPDFFNTPINQYPTGRWFIELELCNIIPTKMGYYPTSFFDWDGHIRMDLQEVIDIWIEQNKLYHLSEYKQKLFDRKYIHDQIEEVV